MRIRLSIVLCAALVGVGCDDQSTRGTTSTGGGDMVLVGGGDGPPGHGPGGSGGDMSVPTGNSDGGLGSLGDGGVFNAPGDMGTVMHAPPGTLTGVTTLGAGTDFRDVSTDEGHGVWATTSSTVYYFHGGATSTYTQAQGLAQGHTTWTTDYWCGPGNGPPCPATYNVSFTSVAGGVPGQVLVGNLGYSVDRLDVDPTTGAVRDVVGVQVTSTQCPTSSCNTDGSELPAQQQREVASWKVTLDLNGTLGGTAYFGGWHGTSALHGLTSSRTSGVCGQGCADYEEHAHGFFNGNTDTAGRDVRALVVTPEGDLWMGDADVISFLPQRSAGANADFFQPVSIPGQPNAQTLDVFPGVVDDTFGMAVDKAHGLYIASYGNGLAYLTANSYTPTYWSAADKLPQNYLTSVIVDGDGDVWIGTDSAGVVRYQPSSQTWVYYTTASGLPSNNIRAIYLDKYAASGRGVYFATANGIGVYTGP
jgi:Two component regulator propeller